MLYASDEKVIDGGEMKDRNILFIGMKFNDYELDIKKAFEDNGYSVDFYVDLPLSYTRLCIKKLQDLLKKNYQNKILMQVKGKIYNVVFVIGGRYLRNDFLMQLKKEFKSAKFILYLWDSVGNKMDFQSTRHIYNKIYSFDYYDCKKYGLTFLPLFYSTLFSNDYGKSFDNDIYGVMNGHSDRMDVVLKLLNKIKGVRINICIVSGRKKYFYFLLKLKIRHKSNCDKLHIKSRNIDKKRVIAGMNGSKAILDIQYPGQNGLTMRTIEAFGMQKKIITTNENIRYYDFYEPENVFLIDRNNPVVDFDWLSLPYKKSADNLYKKYSIENWIRTILFDIEENYLKTNKL